MSRAFVRIFLANSLLVVASVAVTLLGFELFLWANAILSSASPSTAVPTMAHTVPASSGDVIAVPDALVARAEQRKSVLTMPKQWERTITEVPGSVSSYYWQGALHVHNQDRFRRAKPFPDKSPDIFRVAVFGDSLTYGYGISEEDTFVSLLNDWLGREYQVEFLNLGISGAQSEDILQEIKKWLPILRPNLVIYAICQNDFLPSGQGQHVFEYAFPLPASVKQFFIDHTYTGAFINDTYDGTLRRLHLRRDFFDDILSGFGGYQRRFRSDVAKMNSAVMAAGLPSLLAMVVDQYPSYGGRGYQISRVAEDAATAAGAVVIPTEDFYAHHDGQYMYVSKWEGHPNEVANYIWASMIWRALRQRSDLQKFRR